MNIMQKYVFRKYNPDYRAFFAGEKKKIRRILGSPAKIEHVGSTAVSGLGGKPLVDILVGVPNIQKAKEKLESRGYNFGEKFSTKERLVFGYDYPYKNRKRRVHLHVTKSSSRDWNEIMHFRDYLREHPEACEEYAKIKKEAIKKARGEGEIYRNHKKKFIKSILRKASRERQ